MGIEDFINRQLKNRETRLNSPVFKAEMAREKTEFKSELKTMGDNALDFVYTGIGKEFLWGNINVAAKVLFKEKYGFDKFMIDSTKNTSKMFGKALRTLWATARVTGKAAKIGIRHVIAK